MVRLTAALISAIHDGADIASITSLIVPRRDLDQLVGLDACESLTRIDLSDNQLSSLEGIMLCTNLQLLSVAGNQLRNLKGVENLTKLTVLNASRNKLTSISEVAGLTELRALILNDNEISSVCRLDHLVNLNTFVLSRNPIRNLGKFAFKLLSLKKLSLSHCQVQVLGSSLKHCVALEELRLAHNQLSSLPQELERNGRLTILDIGTNHLQTWLDVQVLSTLHNLVNVNLRGNPLCSENNYENEVVKRLPYLRILDGHPVQKNNGRTLAVSRKAGDEKFKMKSATKLKQQTGEEEPQDDTKEDHPFIDLLSFPETKSVSKTVAEDAKFIKFGVKSKKRKDDSGVVSVFDITKGRPSVSKFKGVHDIWTDRLEIGVGGPSTWDDVSTQDIADVQRTDQVEKKPYSRWALKKKK